FQNQLRILPIRFLLARSPALNLRCVSNPQLKLQLSYQSLEPACLTAGFHAHSHLGTLCRQLAIEPLGFLAMLQSSLLKLATLCVKQRNLLKLGVKICSYNDHCSAPFSRALVGLHHQIYSGVGADIVMESITPTTGWDRRSECNGLFSTVR